MGDEWYSGWCVIYSILKLNNMWPDMPTAINIRHHIYNSFLMRTYPCVLRSKCTCRCMQNKQGKRNSNKSWTCKISVNIRYVYLRTYVLHCTTPSKRKKSDSHKSPSHSRLNNPAVKGLKTRTFSLNKTSFGMTSTVSRNGPHTSPSILYICTFCFIIQIDIHPFVPSEK